MQNRQIKYELKVRLPNLTRVCGYTGCTDAVILCRKLEVRYLWIDALCTIQKGDGGVDWSLESPKMTLIYAQAYATITAASGKSSDESFLFSPRMPFVTVPFRETVRSFPDGDLLFGKRPFNFSEEFEDATFNSPLAQRGWVRQERLFSRRVMHFTERQIYWECRGLFWAKNGEACTPLGYDGPRMAATFARSPWLLLSTKGSSQETIARYQFLAAWTDLVDEYSDLQLTYGTDRFPGISGLARAASLFFPGRYPSGIWEHTLSSGLLWVLKRRPMTLVEGECAPSWSWASTAEAVRSAGGVSLDETTESRITLEHVSTSSNDSEILVLSGQLYRCYVSLTPEPKPVIRRRKDAWEAEAHVDSYRFWPAPMENLENGREGPENVCHSIATEGPCPSTSFSGLSALRHKPINIVEVCF